MSNGPPPSDTARAPAPEKVGAQPAAAALALPALGLGIPVPDQTQPVTDRIDDLVKEARVATGAQAAALWFQIGRLYEQELGDVRNAAGHYQASHKADPGFLPVIHAARRLFAQLGKWGMVAVLLDEEIKLDGAPVTALLVEKAHLHETRLARPEDALTLYQQALDIDAAYAPALDAIVRQLESKGWWSEVVRVLQAGALASKRPAQRAAWLHEIGRITEARLHDDEAALAVFLAAERALPGQRAVLDSLRRLYARRGEHEQHAGVLERLAESASSGAEAVGLLCERARILASQGHDKRAIEALEQARDKAPEHPLILVDLARLYERTQMWPAVVEILEVHARVTHDKTELLALFSEAGRLAEDKLGDVERAIRLYGSCIEADRAFSPALTALGKLFAKTGRHRELSSVYAVQIAATSDPQQKVNLLFKQAELLTDTLEDHEAALLHLTQLLDMQPGWVPALKMASSLYARLQRFEELIGIYEKELACIQTQGGQGSGQAMFLLDKVAGVLEDKLNDPQRAVEVYRRMLVVQPGYLPALRSLGHLYARLERWVDLLAVNTEEAELVGDQNHIVALLYRNGEILADKLSRTDDAVAAYRQALQLMPNYLPALKALGAIFARAGRYTDLIAMHREEAEIARRKEQRVHLLFMIAQIYEDKLADRPAAIEAYQAVLAEDAAHHPAMRALARIALVQGDWQALLKINARELSLLGEGRDRALLRCRMAEIYDRHLHDVDSAVRCLHEAIRDSSFLLSAHEQLVSLHARLGHAQDEARARERMHEVLPDVEGRVANLRELAEHALLRLNDPQRALEAAQRILLESSGDAEALRLALKCALRLKDYRLAIELAEQLAGVEPAADEVANLYIQIASWQESHVDPPKDSLPAYVRVLEFAPDHPTALHAVERAYVERQAWDCLFALYATERARATKASLIADLSMKMGELAERRLGQPEVALVSYERVLQVAPNSIAAITLLKDLYGHLGRAADQLRMLSLEASASNDPARAIHTLLEVGVLQRDRFGDAAAAVACFTKVLEREPLHLQAYQWLEKLFVEASRWEDLAALYVQRAAHLVELPRKIDLLTEAAILLSDRLKRFGAAADIYQQVLGLAPGHARTLLALGQLRFALQEWAGAVAAYSLLVQQGGDPLSLLPVHFHLGVIFSEHRLDAQRAIHHLSSCLALEPENRDARKRLAHCYAIGGSPAQALTTYQELAAGAVERPEQKDLHLVLARLHEHSLNDLPAAAREIELAMAASDDRAEQRKLLEEVAALYQRSGDLAKLFELTRLQAEQVSTTDPKRAAALLFRNAVMQLERARDGDGALKSAQRALELDGSDIEVRAFVADGYARMPGQALLAIEEHRRILRSGRVRPASVKALYKTWLSQRSHDRAFVAAEILSFLGMADDSEELFFNDNKKRLKKESQEALTAVQLRAWLLHPAQRNAIHDVLEAAAADLGKALADGEIELVDRKMIFKPKAEDPVRRLADEIALNLGAPPFDVHKQETRRSLVRSFTAQPPVLAVGVDVAKLQPTREQKFLLGKEILAIAAGHTLIRSLDVRGLAALLTAIGRSIDKGFPLIGATVPPDLEAQTKKIGSALSRKAKAALVEPLAALAAAPHLDLQAFLDVAPLSQARAGLLLSGAFDAAVRLIAKDAGKPLATDAGKLIVTIEAEPRLADLVSFALSDDHFQARQALRLAIDT